jgi:nitrogen fixation protein NifU and related proteins
MSESFYNATVMDHFLNPRNVGELPDADAVAEVSAPGCGDILKLSIRVGSGGIEEVRFKALGCGAAIASSSMATLLIKGRSIQEALRLSNVQVVEALGGLPPEKMQCSVLAQEAIRAALADYFKRHPQADLRIKN